MRKRILSDVAGDLEVLRVDPTTGTASFRIDLSIYPLQAVYGACYEYLDRAYVLLGRAPGPKQALIATLRGKGPARLGRAALGAIAGEFANKLLDHALRVEVAKKNARVREMVVARALLSAAPPMSDGDDRHAEPPVSPGDAEADPFAISPSWQADRTARRPG
jgi:His-Xaa-Ser system protein HxsD